VCLSLNEVLVFVLVLVLDVLQEMDPGVLLQRSGKVLVREEKRTSFSCFVFRKFYSVFSLCKSCWDEILDSFSLIRCFFFQGAPPFRQGSFERLAFFDGISKSPKGRSDFRFGGDHFVSGRE